MKKKIRMKHLVIFGIVMSAFVFVVSAESLFYHMRTEHQSSALEFDFRTASMFASMGDLPKLHYWYKAIGEDSQNYASENRLYILFGATAEHRDNYVFALDNYYQASLHGRKLQNDYDSDSKQAIKYLKVGNEFTDKATDLSSNSFFQTVAMFLVSLVSLISLWFWYNGSWSLDKSIYQYLKAKYPKVRGQNE